MSFFIFYLFFLGYYYVGRKKDHEFSKQYPDAPLREKIFWRTLSIIGMIIMAGILSSPYIGGH